MQNSFNKSLTAIAMSVAFMVGCGPSKFSGGPAADGSATLKSLNAMSISATKKFVVQFKRVDMAGAIQPAIGCPGGGANCHLPSGNGLIIGVGGLDAPDLSLSVNDQLQLSASFSMNIGSAQSCLATATHAMQNHHQLEIKGEATILPMPSEGAGATATSLEQVIQRATQIRQSAAPPAVFVAPAVSVVLNVIESCQEGGEALAPPSSPIPSGIPGALPVM